MAKTETGTRVDEVLQRLRSDILRGRLRPGDRLKFPVLCAEFQVSAGVVREALSRLTDQGLVRMQPHQGFHVTPLSYEDLRELTAARIAVETMVFRLSVEHGDLAWETGTVAAHHMLARTPLADPADEAGWLAVVERLPPAATLAMREGDAEPAEPVEVELDMLDRFAADE